jgi:ferritin-like protein
LLERLRKADAITLWDYNQFAVLLPGANEDFTEDILKRALAQEKEDTKILINQLYKLPSFQCKTG